MATSDPEAVRATTRERHARSFRADMAAYARARPGYPDAVVDWLLPHGARDVVDLGAGAGQLTRALVDRGLRVTAVEPSPSMRAQLSAALPGVPVLDGAGEAVPLPDGCADAVLCAQAWHWVDPAPAGAEVVRLLRPGGWLGLAWNVRDERDPFCAELGELLRGGATADATPAGPGSGEPDVRAPLVLERAPDVAWTQALDPGGLVDLVASRSYVLVLDADARDRVLDRAAGLGRRWAAASASGAVEVGYVAQSWRAAPRGTR